MPPALPYGTTYRRLAVGLDNGHDGWALDPAEMEADGITPDALRIALGRGWTVRDEEDGEVIVRRHDDTRHARADLERAFLDAA